MFITSQHSKSTEIIKELAGLGILVNITNSQVFPELPLL